MALWLGAVAGRCSLQNMNKKGRLRSVIMPFKLSK
jgi:hypothetical protein